MTDYVKSTNFASKDSLATGNPLKIVKGTEIDTEFNNIATAVATKADINSPALIGTPTAPTASAGNNTTLVATTAFVTTAVSNGITNERTATATLTNKTLTSPSISDAVLTGNPTAPTPATSDNDTSVATTAFVKAALQTLYPVGSIYINATSSTNPSTLLGFGTWTEFGSGRVLVSQNASDALFDTLEETGGSKDAIVVSHTHTATSTVTDPGHVHNVPASMYVAASPSSASVHDTTPSPNLTVPTASSTTGITVSTSIGSAGSSGTNANVQPYIVVKMWKRTA